MDSHSDLKVEQVYYFEKEKKNGECVFGLENKGPPLSFVGGKKTLERGKITITILSSIII